jgi:hypothetical protein
MVADCLVKLLGIKFRGLADSKPLTSVCGSSLRITPLLRAKVMNKGY